MIKKKLKIFSVAALVLCAGCVNQEKIAKTYFATHPETFASNCARQFPTKTVSERIVETPGPTVFVDCDSLIAANATALNVQDGTQTPLTRYSANASSQNKSAGRRNIASVNCPPSKVIETTKIDQAAEMAAKVESEAWRTKYNDQLLKNKELESKKNLYKSIAKYLAIIGFIYIVIRIVKAKFGNIPIIGYILKLIP